jgi:hypothetical protein
MDRDIENLSDMEIEKQMKEEKSYSRRYFELEAELEERD